MTELIPNTALAYHVLDTARANAEHFDMSVWGNSISGRPIGLDDLTSPECGTTACFAGWTVATAGYRIDTGAALFDADGKEVLDTDAVDLAADLLGITDEQAGRLFYAGDNGIEAVVAEIFGPRPVPVDEGIPTSELPEYNPEDERSPADRWSAMVPNPHPMANCGPLLMQLPPGVMCPTCGTVPPVPELPDDVAPNAGSAS